MSRLYAWMSNVAHMHESCHAYESIMSRIEMGPTVQMNDLHT